MSLLHISFNDWIQYLLIAALIVTALADRAAHRTYTKLMKAEHLVISAQLSRIDAKLDHKDAAP